MPAMREQVGTWTFPPRPESVRGARRAVRDRLHDMGASAIADDAELVISELVTNALVHAGTDINLACRWVTDGLRVEVGDGSPHHPSARAYGATASTGRGLGVLGEIAASWGVEEAPPGKIVWCLLPAAPPAGAVRATVDEPTQAEVPVAGAAPTAARDVIVDVRYLELPVLLVHAWRQHAESLLRELLLVSLTDDLLAGGDNPADSDVAGSGNAAAAGGSVAGSIDMHAAASDAIALLTEHLPAADWWDTGTDLLDDAGTMLPVVSEPAASVAEVRVPVPVASLRHFEVLNDALEHAVTLAREGALLIAPTQPELHAVRRWLCDQVGHQHRGGAPLPWRPLDGDRGSDGSGHSTGVVPGWDATSVTEAAVPMLAVDATDRIVAASASARNLLGYGSMSPVGLRLTDIIPARFRQAHLAGFTLHILTGRAPLLGPRLRAPVLRADGTETDVLLRIERHRTAGGEPVFVATLEVPGQPQEPARRLAAVEPSLEGVLGGARNRGVQGRP